MVRKTRLELWLDKHNHTMELLRTLFGLIAAATGTVVFLKIFGMI